MKGERIMTICTDTRKAAIIGCGFVGAASAFAMMQSGLFTDLVLIDSNESKAEGEAMDISDGIPFAEPMQVRAGTYEDAADASIIIITAGANQKPGETRLDLVQKNAGIFKSIIPQITATSFDGIIVVIANPVDILTYVALKLSGYPEDRVIGSGTVLDTARLRYALGEKLGVDSRSVHSFVIGEHGDSEIPVWSSANVSGIPLAEFWKLRAEGPPQAGMEEIGKDVRNSAYEIISKKGATYYGIAMSALRVCQAIVRDERSILTVSSMMHGEYGVDGIALSTPSIIGASGLITHVPISLSWQERDALQKSASTLHEVAESLDL